MADEKLSHTTQEEVIMSARANFSSRQNMNFFVIYKQLAPNQYRPIYKSEIQPVKTTGNFYEWNVLTLLGEEMTGGDLEREIKMEFYAN